MMETFHPGKLEKHHHYHLHHHHHHPPPSVEFLPGPGSRYGAKSHHHSGAGNAFNSWNDYLGLATLITKAVSQRPEKGFRTGPAAVAATVQQGDEEEEEELEEEEDLEEEEEDLEEEDLEEEEAGAAYFGSSLDLHAFDLCSHHHHLHLKPGEGLLEERFADFSPFSGRSSPASGLFSCAADHLERDRSPHAWDGRLGGAAAAAAASAASGRLPSAPPRSGSRLLKPELQVCVFCRNNKEAVALYTTHILKGPDGRVLCPVLRRYTCPLCGASGDNAHTIKYCPLSKMHGGSSGSSAPKPPLKSARHLLGKKLR